MSLIPVNGLVVVPEEGSLNIHLQQVLAIIVDEHDCGGPEASHLLVWDPSDLHVRTVPNTEKTRVAPIVQQSPVKLQK